MAPGLSRTLSFLIKFERSEDFEENEDEKKKIPPCSNNVSRCVLRRVLGRGRRLHLRPDEAAQGVEERCFGVSGEFAEEGDFIV